MITLQKANKTWWRKPLVRSGGNITTAELAILSLELAKGETGVWMNSRGVTSGVTYLEAKCVDDKITFKTIRKSLPLWLSRKIGNIYKSGGIQKGCPDLVIWDIERDRCRMVEVKCPLWDKISPEQMKFIAYARSLDIDVKIVEWEFIQNKLDKAK